MKRACKISYTQENDYTRVPYDTIKNKQFNHMKYIFSLLIVIIFFAISCVPTFDELGELADVPEIIEIIVGNESGKIPQINAIYADSYLDTVFVKDKTVDFSNIYLNGNLEKGCIIEPLDGAASFGEYGDFSTPRKYRITAPSGKSADWTVVMDYYIPPVGCLTDRWVGNLICIDGIWESYSPSYCIGEKMNDDCQQLKLTFDFWADGGAVAVLELQLGDINTDTFMGDLTLVNDVTVTSYGADMTFHAGTAGTYNATANELYLDIVFSGYDIGADNYTFTVKQSN